jgi:restriction endonuclease S subunit
LDLPGGTFTGAGVKTIVLFFEKGRSTQKTWFYQLNLERNLGKTNPLNETDLAEFVQLQKTFADSENSWTVNVKDNDQTTFDLSVKNPNKKEEVTIRSPQAILEEIEALDEKSTKILNLIAELHKKWDVESGKWEKKKLGEVCVFVRGPFGGSLKKNIFKQDGYAVYEQQHAIYNQFDDVRYFIDENKFNEMKRFELKTGDLIMSCSGTMGKVAIVPNDFKKGIINQALLKISPNNKLLNIYLKLWMQSESFQDSLKEYSGGAAIQNVASVAILKNIEIPLPPLPEQKIIVRQLDAIQSEMQKLEMINQKKNDCLAELKKSILGKAFSKN